MNWRCGISVRVTQIVRVIVIALPAMGAFGPARAAEQWDFRFLMTPRGVHLPEVREIAEDHQGRIWAASWGGGLACLDGPNWTTYTEADGLGSDWVRTVTVGQDGTVWVGTPAGLCRVENGRLKGIHRSALPPLAGDEPFLLFATGEGDLLLGTYEGALFRIPGASRQASLLWEAPEKWELLRARGEHQGFRANDLLQLDDGRIVVAYGDGTWAYLEGAHLSEPKNGPPGGLYFAASDAGKAWAGSVNTGTLYKAEDGELHPLEALPAEIRALQSGPFGQCYVATRSGLFRFDDHGVESVDLGPQVGFPDVNAMHFASDGSLWLGAREGFVRGAPRTWKHYPRTDDGHAILAMVRDPFEPHRILAVDDQYCLAFFSNDGWWASIRLAVPEHVDGFVTAPGQPLVWAMGPNTLYQLFYETGELIAQFPMPETGLDRKLFTTSSGELWLAALDGAHALVNGQWEPRPSVAGYRRRTVNAFLEPEPGVFYVGVRDGIERWADGKVTYYGAAAGVAEDDAVYTICRTSRGEIWFGTYGSGVYQFDGQTFRRYGEAQGLAHHSISNLLETGDGTLWLAYRRVGLASYRDERWLNFGYENGLTNAPIRQMMENGAGQLLILAEKQGIYQYRPDGAPPETYVTAATETVPYGGVGIFSFRAVDAWQRTPAHALLYATRVIPEGREAEWSEFSPETSYITGPLAPGDYRFEVRASDDARNVDPSPAGVAFTIALPLWQEPRVIGPATVLALLAVVALVMRIRAHRDLRLSEAALLQSNQQLMSEVKERIQAERRLSDHFEQLEELVRGRTRELEAAQRALVEQERLATLGKVTASVSHELRNPLGTLRSSLFLIQRKTRDLNLGVEDALSRSERSIQRCDRIIEEFLDFTRTVPMERERHSLDDWLGSVLDEMTLPENIRYEQNLESGLFVEFDPERLRRAVVNVVNNGVQAMQEQGGGRLRIRTGLRNGRAEITIADEGPGMTPESLVRIFEPLYSTKGFGVGLGVPIVRDIMQKHGGGLEYRSAPGEGTEATLWIPLSGPSAAEEVFEDESGGAEKHREADEEPNEEKYNPEDVEEDDAEKSEIVGFDEPEDCEDKSEE